MLCTVLWNGVMECLADVRWSIGNEFNVIGVSIDPNDTPTIATAKKRNYLRLYDRSGAAGGLRLLTGAQTSALKVADEVGCHYVYDPASHQYAHPAGFVILSRRGTIVRYFFGVSFSPTEVAAALKAAKADQVGSLAGGLWLLCFHYNPLNGAYTFRVMCSIAIAWSGYGCVPGIWHLPDDPAIQGRKCYRFLKVSRGSEGGVCFLRPGATVMEMSVSHFQNRVLRWPMRWIA
jgi:protein SCO1/2